MKTKIFTIALMLCFYAVVAQNNSIHNELNKAPVKCKSNLKSLLTDTISIPLSGKYIEDLASCDIDLDGKDELIVLSNYGFYTGSPQIGQLLIYSWINSSFQLLWQSQEINGYPFGIQIADMNNDNYNDILVSCSGVQLFLNNSGAISYYGMISSTTPDDIFLVSDLNNDNKPDLGLGSPAANSDYSIKLYEQNSLSGFIYNSDINGTVGSNMVKVINADNDGYIDILNGEIYSGDVYVFKNNQFFTFNSIFTYKFNTRIFSIESADFDNDNFEDFIVTEMSANVHFFKNKQDTFEIEYESSNIGSTFSTKAIDINNDNLIDLVVASFDGNIYLYKNNGNFQFQEISANTDYVSRNYGLAAGDFDNDGNIDLAYGGDPAYIAFNVNDAFSLSINNNIIRRDIKIYPNPANDKIEIETPGQSEIEILNVQGQIIQTENTINTKATVDVSKLSGGVYFIKVKTNEVITVKKIIKQ